MSLSVRWAIIFLTFCNLGGSSTAFTGNRLSTLEENNSRNTDPGSGYSSLEDRISRTKRNTYPFFFLGSNTLQGFPKTYTIRRSADPQHQQAPPSTGGLPGATHNTYVSRGHQINIYEVYCPINQIFFIGNPFFVLPIPVLIPSFPPAAEPGFEMDDEDTAQEPDSLGPKTSLGEEKVNKPTTASKPPTADIPEIDYNSYYNSETGVFLGVVKPLRKPTFQLPPSNHSDPLNYAGDRPAGPAVQPSPAVGASPAADFGGFGASGEQTPRPPVPPKDRSIYNKKTPWNTDDNLDDDYCTQFIELCCKSNDSATCFRENRCILFDNPCEALQ